MPAGFSIFFQLFAQGTPIQNMSGIRVPEFLILNPEVSVGDVAVKDVLTVFGV